MGALDLVMNEAQSRFGISETKVGSLVAGLLSYITQQGGGISGFLDRFRSAGLGDILSAWTSGTARNISGDQLENVLGSNTISSIASKAGLSTATATSALAFLMPKLVQSLAPGGTIPTRLPSELMSYISGPTAAVAAGARQAVYAAERATEQSGLRRYVVPLLALLAAILIGFWIWSRGTSSAFNAEDQVRMAGQKAMAALTALKPGFSGQDLVSVLNLNIINFPSGSAEIPAENQDFLNKAATVIRSAPAGTVIEVGGHTDNTGDSAANLQLSQQRADAVRDYLVRQGADASALVTKGYGDTRPIASNDTEEGKFRNRRIEFSVMK